MVDAKAKFDMNRKKSAFWMDWIMSPAFAQDAKKKYSTIQLQDEFKMMGDMELSIDSMEAAIKKIRSMRAAQLAA